MEQFYTMASVQATLFIYMAVGYLGRKKNIITPQVLGGITNILVYILLPCMVFDSFNQTLEIDELMAGLSILVVAFAMSFLAWGLGWLLWRNYKTQRATILRYGTLVANSGFAGLPVISGAYGVEGLFYASIFIIPNRIFMWSAGISLFRKDEEVNWVKNVLLNPGIVAVFLGVIRMLLQLKFPAFLDTAIGSMGDCTTVLSIIIVGSILADVDGHKLIDRDIIAATVVRLVALPLCALVLLKLIAFQSLGTSVAVILTGMPVGSTTAILAQKYGGDAQFGSKCVFVSTVCSLFTIPLLTLLM